ncbi:MAG: DoxX family protein [Chloroflexota bacterium]
MGGTLRDLVRIGLALVMAGSGIAHFVAPRPYIQHLPDVVPFRGELVAITGVMELVLAVGLVGPRRFRRLSGIGLAAFLVLVFPANAYAAVSQVPIDGVPTGFLRWARLPFQLPLIVAALWSTHRG